MAQTLLQTPLHDRHVALGARMVPFAGWEMPVQYEGVIQEHRAVRTDAGVFDVSHMGEIEVEGPRAHELLQGLLSNDLDRLEPGQAQYTLLTNERGGIVDDLIAYRLERVPLPARRQRVEPRGRLRAGSRSARSAAPTCATSPTSTRCSPCRGRTRSRSSGCAPAPSFTFAEETIDGVAVHGQPHRLHGRGRLRAPLHGGGRRRALGRGARARRHAVRARRARHAAARGVLPAARQRHLARHRRDLRRARLDVRARARSSPASTSCAGSRSEGPERKLVAFVMEEKAIPRQGMPIEGGGEVTSGTHSPMLDVGIGMGYVPAAQAAPGTELTIDVRGKPRSARGREETDLQEGGLRWPLRSRIRTT